MSTEKSKKASEVQEIDFSAVVTNGPLYVNPKHLEPGFRHILPVNRPGEIEYYTQLGYEVVKDYAGDIFTGTDKASTTSSMTTNVEINSKCGAKHILMRCPVELHEKFEAYMKKVRTDKLAGLGHVEGIAQVNQFGNVTISNSNKF